MASWFQSNGFLAGDEVGGSPTYPGGPPVTVGDPGGPQASTVGTGPKVFDPNAPAYNPYAPGEVVRQPIAGSPGGGFDESADPNAQSGAAGTPVTPSGPSGPTSDFPGPWNNNGGYGPNPIVPGSPAAGSAMGGDVSHRLPGESTRDWVRRAALSIGRSDIANDPGALDYWEQSVNSKPQSDDMGYWLGKLQTPDNGGSGASGGAGGMGAGGLGAFLQPYDKQFQAPVGTDDPGFKFALGEGVGQIERGQAVKGNLLTGGALKDIQAYTTGAALQDYSGAYNRALSTFGTNYDVFRNNQTDPFNKLFAVTGLGFNAASGQNAAGAQYGANLVNTGRDYGSNLTNAAGNFGTTSGSLVGNQGNINAAGTIGRQNNYNNALSAFTDWYQHQFPGTA